MKSGDIENKFHVMILLYIAISKIDLKERNNRFWPEVVASKDKNKTRYLYCPEGEGWKIGFADYGLRVKFEKIKC